MDNPVIQTDIAEVLKKLDSRLDKIDERLNRIEIGQSEIRGDLKAMDERLSGQIKAVDERLSGQIKAVNVQLEQLDKRVGNQEFTNRGILIGIAVIVLGGAAKFFGFIGTP